MNNKYVCEYLGNDGREVSITIKAIDKRNAKSVARKYLRKCGYNAYLKNINIMYIDNSRKAVNE